jgi:hypothetical protein
VLAGRPPFLGSNPVSVIRQASETQAPKLRSLAPSLDRDLETICARCLERDPKARYQSAGHLAADLERWLEGRPIVARPVSPPARIWRWSRRNRKLVGTATAGVLLGAAAVSLFHTEFFRASQFNPPDKKVAISADEQPGNNVYDLDLQHLFTDVTPPTGTSSIGVRRPVQNELNPLAVPDYTSPGSSDSARVTTLPPEKGFAARLGDRELEPGLRTDKVTADVIAAPPGMAFNTSARDRASEAGLQTNKITEDGTVSAPRTESITSGRDRALEAGLRTNKIAADGTVASPGTGSITSGRDRTSEAALRTTKIPADGPASIQGFVKDATGEPIKGADIRIESRDGKHVFSIAKTDPKGRYVSQGLKPGVYRVTLLVNGAAKASIMNTQTKASQPTQLNFDFKPTSQAGNIAKGRKRMVWVPNRTGSHIGGTWVEVDDGAEEHSGSNIQTYTARRW